MAGSTTAHFLQGNKPADSFSGFQTQRSTHHYKNRISRVAHHVGIKIFYRILAKVRKLRIYMGNVNLFPSNFP